MSIADKLIYLNTTKEKLKDSINNIGGSITDETTFRAYAEELDNIYSNIPKTTGEGSNLSLTTIKGRINVDNILGDTQQYSTKGYQLWNLKDGTYSNNGIQAVVLSGKVSLTGTATQTAFVSIPTNTSLSYTDGQQYTISANNNIANSNIKLRIISTGTNDTAISSINTTNTITYTTNTNVYLNQLVIRVENGTAIVGSITMYPMLELGSTAHTWEKYTGESASPSPTYPQNIEVVTGKQDILLRGDNLFDGELELGIINSNTGASGNNDNYIRTKNYTLVEPSTYYIISTDNTSVITDRLFVYEYDSNYTYTGRQLGPEYSSTYGGYMFMTSPNVKYIRFRPRYATTDITIKFMMEKRVGTASASAWQPYQEQTKIVNLSSKNKFNYATDFKGSATLTNYITNNNDGTFTTTGTGGLIKAVTKTLPKGTYTISIQALEGYSLGSMYIRNTGGTNATPNYTFTLAEEQEMTFDIRAHTDIVKFYIVLNEGSTALPYEPYYNYELSKIGTYQDRIYKNNDKWYIEKNIGKQIYKGANTEGWTERSDVVVSGYKCYRDTYFDYTLLGNISNSYCNYFTYVTSGNTANTFRIIKAEAYAFQCIISDTLASNVTNFKTWLASHNLVWLYVLATPTYEEITNTNLLNELNELEKIMSYNGTTNINISGNLPMLVSVSALKGE